MQKATFPTTERQLMNKSSEGSNDGTTRERNLNDFSDDILYEIITHTDQRTKLSLSLVNSRFHTITNKILYRQIYLNDCSVVESHVVNLANRWTILYLPELITESRSRRIADVKLKKLIGTFVDNPETTLKHVEWIRINWDLDRLLQKEILELICNGSSNLIRLENVIDPDCYEIISEGKYSNRDSKLLSFDMAPPNSLPQKKVDSSYMPNFFKFLDSRLYNNIDNITTLTLFIDPVILFGLNNCLDEEANFGLYPKLLRNGRKLYIKDLKLHWRMEFFSMSVFQLQKKAQTMNLPRLSDLFDTKTLEILTIISWEEDMVPRYKELLKEVSEFRHLKDLSLISLQQSFEVLQPLFDLKNMPDLKRLKFDFLDGYDSDNASPLLLRLILDNCKNLEYLDIRSNEFLIQPIVSLRRNIADGEALNANGFIHPTALRNLKFCTTQQCYCFKCCNYFDNFLTETLFPKDLEFSTVNFIKVQEFFLRDIFKSMKHYGLFPYSKATDIYPSVRTQPMNIKEFVKKVNIRFFLESTHPLITDLKKRIDAVFLDQSASLKKIYEARIPHAFNDFEFEEAFEEWNGRFLNQVFSDDKYSSLFINGEDVVKSVHTLFHHNKKPYEYILSKLPNLKFLVFNDLPVSIVEKHIFDDENKMILETRRVIQPVFFSEGYTCNLFRDTTPSNPELVTSMINNKGLERYEREISTVEKDISAIDFEKDMGPYMLYPEFLLYGFKKLGSLESSAVSMGYPSLFIKKLNLDEPSSQLQNQSINMTAFLGIDTFTNQSDDDEDEDNF